MWQEKRQERAKVESHFYNFHSFRSHNYLKIAKKLQRYRLLDSIVTRVYLFKNNHVADSVKTGYYNEEMNGQALYYDDKNLFSK